MTDTTTIPSDWDPLDPIAVADPIAEHARLRLQCPVAHSDQWGGFWALSKYDDIVRATEDTDTFRSYKSNIPPSTGANDPPRAPLEIDPPDHDGYRKLLNPYFAPRIIRAFEPEIRRIAGELLDDVIAAGETDVVPALAFPMPVRVLCAFLGLPDEDAIQIKTWANDVIAAAIGGDKEGHARANASIYAYNEEQVALRRANPRDPDTDLMTGLLVGHIDGHPLGDAEVAGILRLLLAAGHGTTTNAIGSTVRYLAENPDDQRTLRDEPALVPNAIEEILRMWSPSRALGRLARRDSEYGGREIASGDRVALLWASANRDADAFENPDTVDIHRRPNPHIAFGHGIHTCLGSPLARAELRIVVEELFARTSSVAIAGDVSTANWPHIGPTRLPVRFEAQTKPAVAHRAAPVVTEIDATVVARRDKAAGVVEVELASADGTPLPKWAPGAHVDLVMKDGLLRQYSLTGSTFSQNWRVAVLREEAGRGGSAFVHDELLAGDSVRLRGPRNTFEFVDSPHYLFIAGGIGITPFIPMIEQAAVRGREWQLIYLGRKISSMAFAQELAALGERALIWPAAELGRFDLASRLAAHEPDTLIYSCGPERMLEAVEQAASAWQPGSVHLERFAPKPFDESDGALDEFEVELRRSGVRATVPKGASIVEICDRNGITVPTFCREGTCGSCETLVLGGVPAHRDSVLSPEDRASGEYIMPCISRSKTPTLVLDL